MTFVERYRRELTVLAAGTVLGAGATYALWWWLPLGVGYAAVVVALFAGVGVVNLNREESDR